MLKIMGGEPGNCSIVARRSFLQVGALALGGLSLADLERCCAASPW